MRGEGGERGEVGGGRGRWEKGEVKGVGEERGR